MATGRVKWFDATKGFGFIKPEDGGADVFVHFSALKRAGLSTLVEKQKISYELVADRKTGKTAADQLKTVEGQSRAIDRRQQPGEPSMAPAQIFNRAATKPADARPRLDQGEVTQARLDEIGQDADDLTTANRRPEY